jgi:hypothetical protein
MATAMAAVIGIQLTNDSIDRDAVFAALKKAMEKYSPADFLQQAAALEQAVAAGEGTLSIAPENGAFIYTVNQVQQIYPLPLSPEELGWIQKCNLFFSDFKNGYLLTISHIQGLSFWEKINAFSSAVLLAMGAVGFAANCINAGQALINCGKQIFNNVKELTVRSLKIVRDCVAAPLAAPLADPADAAAAADAAAVVKELDKIITVLPTAAETMVVKNVLVWRRTGLTQKDRENLLTRDQKIELFNKQQKLHNFLPASEKSKTAREFAKNHFSGKLANSSSYPGNPSGGGRTKRRSYKSKRRRISKSKRRRHKTKKRAYRSTRFASHK